MALVDQLNQQANTFPLFPQLPSEVRLLIWEHTWPDARIIEAVIITGEEEDESSIVLSIMGLMSPILDAGYLGVKTNPPLNFPDPCAFPVALQTCYESRQYTLSKYRLLQSRSPKTSSFYFSPERDVLCLDDLFVEYDAFHVCRFNFGQDLPDPLSFVIEDHSKLALGTFKTIYIANQISDFHDPARAKKVFLDYVASLETIVLLLGDSVLLKYWVEILYEHPRDEIFLAEANKIKADWTEYLKSQSSPAKRVLCRHYNGRYY